MRISSSPARAVSRVSPEILSPAMAVTSVENVKSIIVPAFPSSVHSLELSAPPVGTVDDIVAHTKVVAAGGDRENAKAYSTKINTKTDIDIAAMHRPVAPMVRIATADLKISQAAHLASAEPREEYQVGCARVDPEVVTDVPTQSNDLHSLFSYTAEIHPMTESDTPLEKTWQFTEQSPKVNRHKITAPKAANKRKLASNYVDLDNSEATVASPKEALPKLKKAKVKKASMVKAGGNSEDKEEPALPSPVKAYARDASLEKQFAKESATLAAKNSMTSKLKKSLRALNDGPKALRLDKPNLKNHPQTVPSAGATIPYYRDIFTHKKMHEKVVDTSTLPIIETDPNDPKVRKIIRGRSTNIFRVTTLPRLQGGEQADIKKIRELPNLYPHIEIKENEGLFGTVYIRNISPEGLVELRKQEEARVKFKECRVKKLEREHEDIAEHRAKGPKNCRKRKQKACATHEE